MVGAEQGVLAAFLLVVVADGAEGDIGAEGSGEGALAGGEQVVVLDVEGEDAGGGVGGGGECEGRREGGVVG